ncbi:ACT domain-containing protein [Rhizobiaceae bacterium]|nr:ACT domain-containing protein [Rhizobiaceae bacterium]
MSGERDLDTLLATMRPELVDGVHVFATVPDGEVAGLLATGLVPRMLFREAEGTTLILLREEAERLALAHEFPCRMISLNVHSALDAVGFIARVATALADKGMGVNPVSGFYHDHLFVPEGREAEAMEIFLLDSQTEVETQ